MQRKNLLCVFKHIIFLCVVFISISTYAQTDWTVSLHYHYGSIIPHSPNINHLITGPSQGFLLSIDKHSEKKHTWQDIYNDPDIGVSFHNQNNHSQELGDLYGVYAHYNFYFLKRNLQLRIAQGVAYSTNPYDKGNNFRNIAYGSQFMPSTYFMLNYHKPNIYKNIGVNAGLLFTHHSNATIKSPNTSTNTLSFALGVTYDFSNSMRFQQNSSDLSYPDDNQWKINTILRAGINESHIIGMGQKSFYHLSMLTEKPISETGGLQLGGELFLSNSLKELIPFMAKSFPETGINADDDWKRIGVFAGYEWYLNRLSLEGQVGFYVWDQYKQNGSLYQRLGMRYYIQSNWFAVMSLKTHFAKAEAFELGIGYKW